MMNPTIHLGSVLPVQPLETAAPRPIVSGVDSFQQLLEAAVHRVETSGREASSAVDRLLTGEPQDLHSAALAGQKAALEFEMFLQVRNKMVQAYQEVMRMQL